MSGRLEVKEDLLPTHARYTLVAIAVALAMVTYLDRVCISQLAGSIMEDLSLNKKQMSWVFSAFVLAYAAFEIPTAWWADRSGTRRVLTRIVLWWSTFTIATAGAFNYLSLLVTRFLFGAGEAGAWPCVAKSFSRWIPQRERGTVQGIFFAGAHLAGGVTPLLVVWLVQYLHWRTVFFVFGMVGFVWAAYWCWWFRDDPSEHREVNAAELAVIVAGREPEGHHTASWEYWARLFTNRNVLALCQMYTACGFIYYFCITWLPTYLKEVHKFTPSNAAIFAGLPLTLSVLADIFGGMTTDWAAARWGLRAGRAGVGVIAYVLAGLCVLVASLSANPHVMAALRQHENWLSVASLIPYVIAVLIAVATAAGMFTLGASWGTCIEVGGQHAGVVSAAMNTAGQVASFVCPPIVGYTVEWFGRWDIAFYFMSALFFVGAICWCFIDPRKRVFD
jgi:MFS transporter, ACS family, glucarate transporter